MVCENGESKQEKKVKNDITSKGYVFAIKYGCQYSSPRVYIKYAAKILGWQTPNMYEWMETVIENLIWRVVEHFVS